MDPRVKPVKPEDDEEAGLAGSLRTNIFSNSPASVTAGRHTCPLQNHAPGLSVGGSTPPGKSG